MYAVTSYASPRQTERLVARIRRDRPEARIIVSHDRKMPPPAADALAASRAELWLTHKDITWGDITYLESLLDLIGKAQLRPDDWITILTGQDYPIRPLRYYEDHLLNSGADMVLEEPDDDPRLPLFLERYLVRSYRLPHWTDRHRVRQVVKHLPGLAMSSEPRGLPPYLHRRRLHTPFSDAIHRAQGKRPLRPVRSGGGGASPGRPEAAEVLRPHAHPERVLYPYSASE